MGSIFTKIINREIPAHIVAESDEFLAFLDINPLVEGHTLAIPKREVDNIFDLDNATFSGLHLFARKIASAIQASFDCERVGVAVVGLEIPHAHIHLIPINSVEDMNFSRMKLSPSREELIETASKIKSALI